MSGPARGDQEGGRSPRRELIEAQIYEQAARLFAERGYAGTTPQDIADAAGVSRQGLYYYVRSKEEILQRLVSDMATAAATRMQAVVNEPIEAPEKLRKLAHLLVIDRAANRTRFRLLDRSESVLPPDLAKDYLIGRRALLKLVTGLIDDGIAGGFFRPGDSRVAALSVLGMCNWVAWWFEPSAEHPVEPVANQIADNAVAMLQSSTVVSSNAEIREAVQSVRSALGDLDAALS
ncbi:MAG TPA: TetR/AcrR family transcriptional regulator [Galbitalea sp.]